MSHDPHDGMSPGARALLRHAPTPRPRTAAERARTTAAVRRVAATPFIAASVWLSWKGIALASVLALGGAALATRSRPAATPPRATPAVPPTPVAPSPRGVPARVDPPQLVVRVAPSPPSPPPSPPPPAVAPRVLRSPSPRTEPRDPPPPPSASPVGASAGLSAGSTAVAPPPEDETRTLERAHATLQRDPAEALRIVEGASTSERFAEERALIAMEAERRLGNTVALQSRAAGFLARFPRSLYAERVRRWVGP
jgi:hypothetical protein